MEHAARWIVESQDDVAFEQDVTRNPYIVKYWLMYLEHKGHDSAKVRNILYERAVKHLPGSYKLWFRYLTERMGQVRSRPINDLAWNSVNSCFERALTYLHKMPRIWCEYCQFLIRQRKVSQTRRVFDRALRSLPITQHSKIWKLYKDFVEQPFVPPETGLSLFRRYVQLEPSHKEDFIDYLIRHDMYNDAAKLLSEVLNSEGFKSIKEKKEYDLWMELCKMCAQHPREVVTVNVEAMVRQGLRQYSEDIGQLWCFLGEYYVKLGFLEKARDVYEEGMATVTTVRDFSQIFDAYAQMEERIVSIKMEMNNEEEESGMIDEGEQEEDEFTNDDDLEMRLARLEHLMDRRPLLVNSVLLRQNPHNVNEWHKRVKLFKNDMEKIVQTYTGALQAVDPVKAVGKPHTLWNSFARFYEVEVSDVASARKIFERAVESPFKQLEDLGSVWCEYVEMELRHGNNTEAVQVIRRATHVPPKKRVGKRNIYEEETVQQKVHRSTRLWMLYADLEESFGTMARVRAVYDRMMEMKIVNPKGVLGYANYLEENRYFEDALGVYEKGVELFSWPQVYVIWVSYFRAFVRRYKGKHIERARELYEQAIDGVSPEYAKVIYTLYAEYEEEYGLFRHALRIYDRAVRAVPSKERYDMYRLYIRKVMEFFGAPRTREIYEQALKVLPEYHTKLMALKFAELERSLGEIDRARAIFQYASQFSNPELEDEEKGFWKAWRAFEVAHGNEDTFTDMLRIKRSVMAKFNDTVNVSSSLFHVQAVERAKAVEESQSQELENLRVQALKQDEEGFVPEVVTNIAENPRKKGNALQFESGGKYLGEEEGPVDEYQISEKVIPDSVYQSAEKEKEKALGAMEKVLQKRKKESIL